jgi:polysaccharide export outer membrane protein
MRMLFSTRCHSALWSTATILVLVPLLLQAQAPGPPDVNTQNTIEGRKNNGLGPGDVIAVSALGEEELSKQWTISQSGEIYLPYVGSVHASGKTAAELEAELAQRFRRYLKNPMITVAVVELKSRPVTVNGAVKNPGIYQVAGRTTLYQLLALAGGVEQAGTVVTITRQLSSGTFEMPGARLVNGSANMINLSVKDVLEADSAAGQLEMRPYDVVGVERSGRRRIYIAGEVNTPGTIQLDTSRSVYTLQAIAMVGGYKNTAQLEKAILGKCCDANQNSQLEVVNVRRILDRKDEDRLLSDGDFLMLPPKKQNNILSNLASIAALLSASSTLAVVARY